MPIQLISGQYCLVPRLRCHICGNTQKLHRNKKSVHGNSEIACMDCLFVWYDQGLSDPSEIRAASLQRQGRVAS